MEKQKATRKGASAGARPSGASRYTDSSDITGGDSTNSTTAGQLQRFSPMTKKCDIIVPPTHLGVRLSNRSTQSSETPIQRRLTTAATKDREGHRKEGLGSLPGLKKHP